RDLPLERLDDSRWGRARIDEPLRHRLDAEVEAFERARAQEDQVPRFSEYHFVSYDLAGDVHEDAAGPPLEQRAVGLAEQPLVVALDSERVEEMRRDPGQLRPRVHQHGLQRAAVTGAGGVLDLDIHPERSHVVAHK